MERILIRIADEPAIGVALILAALNVWWDLSAAQTATVATWVESGVAILAGILIRQNVSPMSKLKRKGLAP